jgi:hypothetical protein
MDNGRHAARAVAGIGILLGLAFPGISWREWKERPGANYYDVLKSFTSQKAERDAAEAGDLTRVLQPEGRFYEAEDDFHFRRWADFVEPRVSPSGDLRLLQVGQEEMLQLTALDGKRLPAMSGAWEAPLGPLAANTMGAGRLNFIEFHPTENNTYMVGSPGGGLWFTRNGGQSWSTTTDQLANLGATWAAYDPGNPDIIYLGTGDGFGSRDISSIGLLKSTDGGRTWNTTGLSFPVSAQMQIVKVAVNPRNAANILVATSQGLQISMDGAATFRAAAGITGKVWDIEFQPANPGIVYASTTGFFLSSDGGATFTRSNGPTAGVRMQIAVTAAQSQYVYALCGSEEGSDGVYRSGDGGRTFNRMGDGKEVGCFQAYYDYALDANPLNANELTAGCVEMFLSGNGGASWSKAGSDYHVDIHDIKYRKDGSVFAATDGGLWRRTGGGAWTSLNNNLSIGQSYRVGLYPGDYDQLCTGRQDNGSDIRGGAGLGWKGATPADGFECFWNRTGTRWYGEAQFGFTYAYNYSNGQTVGAMAKLPEGGQSEPWNNPWGADVGNESVIYAGRSQNLVRSANNGQTWTRMGTMGSASDKALVKNFTQSRSHPQVIYAVRNGGSFNPEEGAAGAGVFKTENGGGSWRNVTGNLDGTPTAVALSATDPDDVWVTVSGYQSANKVFRSRNGGQTWSNETLAGLPNLPANTVVMDDLGKGGVYVGLDVGVYFKNDGMTGWRNFSDGLPNVQIRELEIGSKGAGMADRRLFAATFGRGIMRTRLWDDVITDVAPGGAKPPRVSGLSVSMSASVLEVRFRLGPDGRDGGDCLLQVRTLKGQILHQESIPGSGEFIRSIPMARRGHGVLLLAIRRAGDESSRREAVKLITSHE